MDLTTITYYNWITFDNKILQQVLYVWGGMQGTLTVINDFYMTTKKVRKVRATVIGKEFLK